MPKSARKTRSNHQPAATPATAGGPYGRDPDLNVQTAELPPAFTTHGPGAGVTPIASSVPPLELAPKPDRVRLDLGCGQNIVPGFEGVDYLAPGAHHRVDLCKFPWPFADNSVDELHSSHFIEHIPNRDVEPRDLVDDNPQTRDRWVGVDMLFAFFDEAWRILKPEGTFRVICPALRSNRAFQDPTHRRFIPSEFFQYLARQNRAAMGLDHYRARCDFQGVCNHTMPVGESLLSDVVQARRFQECWNTVHDWVADMVALKEKTTP
jgi:hypothetical protein